MINLDISLSGQSQQLASPTGLLPAVLQASQNIAIQNGDLVQLRLKEGTIEPTGNMMLAGGASKDKAVTTGEVEIDIVTENVPPTGGNYYLRVSSLTSGALVVGRRYVIDSFVSLDDFTNVGSGSNATGVFFTATGTTPANWTHSSILKEITLDIDYGTPVNIDSTSIPISLTDGLLVKNKNYKIVTFVSGDDFSNIGGVNVTGMSFVAADTTPTDWTHGSILRELVTVEDFLNATGAVSGNGGGVELAPISPIAFNVIFGATGARALITGSSTTLAPSGTTITSEAIRAGTSSYSEIQQITFTIPIVGEVVDLDVLPEAAGTVTEIQEGDADHASIQRITLDPPPIGGSFSFLIDGIYKTAAWNMSQGDMQELIQSDTIGYIVVKSAVNSWDFQWVSNGAQDDMEVVTDGLIVPVGLSGEVNLDDTLLQELRATYGAVTPMLRVKYTPTGGSETEILNVPTSAG